MQLDAYEPIVGAGGNPRVESCWVIGWLEKSS